MQNMDYPPSSSSPNEADPSEYGVYSRERLETNIGVIGLSAVMQTNKGGTFDVWPDASRQVSPQ